MRVLLQNANNMSSEKKLNKRSYARFFWGVASEKEENQLFKSDESEKMLQHHWHHSTEQLSQFRKNRIKAQIDEKINGTSDFTRFFRNKTLLKVAAVLVFGLIITFSYFYYEKSQSTQYQIVGCSNQKFKKITLPDQSTVWIKNGTEIRFADNFVGENKNIREVILSGEAFFEVTHNNKKPFIVKTGGLNVKVYGTSFNVRAFPNEAFTTTSLKTGKISLKTNNNTEQFLKPGEKANFNKALQKVEITKTNTNNIGVWSQNKLVMENYSFIQLTNELQRWFNIEIQLQNTLHHKYHFTMTVTAENIDQVMELIQQTTPDLQIEKINNKYHIYQNK